MSKVTAENLTDEQIREARESDPEIISSQIACDALGLPRGPYEYELQPGDVGRARRWVAAAINARAKES